MFFREDLDPKVLAIVQSLTGDPKEQDDL